MVPGCDFSTSDSCWTTGGVQRTAGSEITTGPDGASVTSGRVSSCAVIEVESSSDFTRPFTRTTVSVASTVDTSS